MTRKRDLLKLADLSKTEARQVLDLATRMKRDRAVHAQLLAGRSIAIIMEKASTRTRVSFDVGCAQLGAHPVVLNAAASQLGRGEPVRDTARVLSRYCDAIVYRTSSTMKLTDMATASVPVVNALSDDGHPVQVLCDVFTIEEQLESPIAGKRIAFVGDCGCNMARSWLEAAVLFDFHLVLAGPGEHSPPDAEVERAGSHVSRADDPKNALADCDVVNTDVWTSMGQEAEADERTEAFSGWTLNAEMLSPAKPGAIVLHCLPAHRGEEIDNATLEGPRSRVWDQAENRLHVQKAILVFLVRGGTVPSAGP